MTKYICLFEYEYQEEIGLKLFSAALDELGFDPKYMSIFYDEFREPEREINFDKERLFDIFSERPNTITVQNEVYNESGDNFWFKFRTSINLSNDSGIYSLEWSNSNLDFLLNSETFRSFLTFKTLLICYCYDQFDSFDQSNTDIAGFLRHHSQDLYKTLRGPFGNEIIDTSEHWGRCENSNGLMFMAAPFMWFGEGFYYIISRKELLQFGDASPANVSGHELVFIRLFDLYDKPSYSTNREKQKAFWKFFELEIRIGKRNKEKPVEFEKLLKERALQKKQKKK